MQYHKPSTILLSASEPWLLSGGAVALVCALQIRAGCRTCLGLWQWCTLQTLPSSKNWVGEEKKWVSGGSANYTQIHEHGQQSLWCSKGMSLLNFINSVQSKFFIYAHTDRAYRILGMEKSCSRAKEVIFIWSCSLDIKRRAVLWENAHFEQISPHILHSGCLHPACCIPDVLLWLFLIFYFFSLNAKQQQPTKLCRSLSLCIFF